ncbi:Short-chain dehydrogenase/reductase SDR [Macleaya cordata]|uniref:Short-chain dehydrogenase/reductase SDR n=1 Tax=Macleaya cordata TaxID=56857 RepID=A0A200Q7G9_MACCD|nr:Short-chain dehydrogenase/reductase SDR [Macleaya cordata]OVA06317.1 Short-chain dehydrogenase/reductase SDR [Macleaya cordata]
MIHCDVTKETDMENLVDKAIEKYGKLDIMYSNAGILGELGRSILDGSFKDLKRVFNVNAFGGFLAAKHAARVMVPAKKGCILFTSSVASIIAGEMSNAYTMSKHTVVGLTKNVCRIRTLWNQSELHFSLCDCHPNGERWNRCNQVGGSGLRIGELERNDGEDRGRGGGGRLFG